MVQTIVRPKENNFDMSVSLPLEYVGKEVHVLFYIDEEVKSTTVSVISSKKPSDFFGILTEKEGDNFDMHLNNIRKEWERNI